MPKKKPQRPSKAKRQALPRLVDKLSLQSVRIIESHSTVTIAGGGIPTSYGTHVEANFGITAESTVLGNVKVSVIGPAPKEDGDLKDDSIKSEWMVLVVVQCIYKAESLPENPTLENLGLSKDEVHAINSTTTFIAWPYVRSHVQATTLSMGLPPVTLPLLRFGDSGEPTK